MSNRIAITGMEAIFADGRGIDSFDRYLYDSDQHFLADPGLSGNVAKSDSQEQTFAAWLLHDYNVSTLAEKLLDSVAHQMNLSSQEIDLVLFSCAEQTKSALGELQEKLHSFVIVSSLREGLQKVENILKDSERVVALVAIHLLADSEMTVSESQESQNLTLAFEAGMGSYLRGEGGGVILCKAANTALSLGDKIYAFIDAVACSEKPLQACEQALQQAEIKPADINYLEASASDQQRAQEIELESMLEFYRNDGELSCALGSARSVMGECGEFSLLAGLIKTALCLYHRYIPGVIHWKKPRQLDNWSKSPFYFPASSRPWYLESEQHKRFAACNVQEAELFTHLVLSENEEDNDRQSGYLTELPLHFFPMAGDSLDSLEDQLLDLKAIVEAADCAKTASRKCYEKYQCHSHAPYALVILGEEKDELLNEIRMMAAGIAAAFDNKQEWKTPKGSYFTPCPVGLMSAEKNSGGANTNNGVAFVYPGVGAAYVGLGQDLFHMFPESFKATGNMSRNIGAMLKDRIINPRSRVALSFQEKKALDLQLRNSLATISECGVGFSYVVTKIFQQSFDIEADFAIGYSMGEVSMYTAMDCWQDPGALSARLAVSPTFNHNLTGEMRTLRRHWDLPPAEAGESGCLWETFALKGTVEEVSQACEDEDRVYITIINTPDSVVIGGDPEACRRVIKTLGVRGMAMELSSAIHSAPAFKEYENMEKLYTLEVAEKINTKLYSSSCYLPVPQRGKAIANSIATCFCEQVDFPRLVNTMYDKGARMFMEMGAGRSCCSWIDKILKHDGEHKPHVSIPVDAKGTPDYITIARSLAKLVSHRVDVNLDAMYFGSMLNHYHSSVQNEKAISPC